MRCGPCLKACVMIEVWLARKKIAALVDVVHIPIWWTANLSDGRNSHDESSDPERLGLRCPVRQGQHGWISA